MFANVKVSLFLFDPETGEQIKESRSLNLGRANVGEFTDPVVIRMIANNASIISNIRIAVIDSTENVEGSGTANTDGSVPVGNMGIEHGRTFEQKTTLESFFPGKNESGITTGGNMVSVENLTRNSSEYVYLNTRVSDSLKSGFIKYKWFFDLA